MATAQNRYRILEDELSVRARQQAAVAELGQRALIGIDLGALMDETVILVANTLEVDYCKILELLPSGDALLLRAGVGWKEGTTGFATVGTDLDSQAGYTLFSKGPVIVEDLRTERRFKGPPLLLEHEVISGMSVIIPGRDKPFGVLGAHTRSRRNFTLDDINFLQSVANVLAAAIERKRVEAELIALNANLEKKVNERAGFIRLLQEVAVTANKVTTVSEAFLFTLDKVCLHTGWPVGHVYILAADAQALDVPVAANPGEFSPEEAQTLLLPTALWHLQDEQRFASFRQITDKQCLPKGVGLPGIAFEKGRPVWFIDLAKETKFVRAKNIPDLPLKSGFAFPVLAGKDIVAMLEFFSEHLEQPDEQILDIMSHIGAQLGRVVERKRAELELENSRLQLAEAQHLARLGSWGWEIMTGKLNWSEELYRIFGLAPGEFTPTYETFLEWVHPDDRDIIRNKVENALRDCQPFEFRHRIIRPDGTVRFLHGQGKVVLEEHGRPVKMLGTAQDITERIKMEDALHESMSMLENLFELAPDGTVLVDGQGSIVRVNKKMESLFGYGREELLGESLEILLPDRFRERHIQHRQNFAIDPRTRPMGAGLELLGRRKDGREFPVDIMLSPLHTDQGLLVIGVIRDISQRKQAIEALQQSEARFRTIFEGAAIGIAFVDLERRILASNPRLQKVLGYTVEELRGMKMTELLHPLDEDLSRLLFADLIAGVADHRQVEKRYIRKDGQVIWANVTISLIRDKNGDPRFAIKMVEDITARKEMEAELAEVQHRLFASREQERIHLAQEIHDAPMQDLYAVLYQLNDIEQNPTQADSSEQIQAMQATLRQVIDTLRSICGDLRPPTLAPFGLEGAIREHAEQFQNKHPELVVNLDLMHDGQMLPEELRVNLFRIYQQALNNVLRHAQASQVDVRFRYDDAEVVLEIEDNGRGFEVPKRWIRLAREGHLGLVGAAERAEMFGGKFILSSAPGKGTRIRVRIPWSGDRVMPFSQVLRKA